MLREFGRIFIDHWYIMFPIAACSAAGIAVVVERALVLSAASSINKDELLNFINSYCMQGQIGKAINTVSQTRGPLSNIVRAGLVTIANGLGPEEVQTAMDAVALREIPRLSRRIDTLSALANVAVLLGLLGTVTGLMRAFLSVGSAELSVVAVTGGIGEALIATACGLGIAIVALVPFNYFNGRLARLQFELETAGTNVEMMIAKNGR